MENKSLGNFMDFIEEASKPTSSLRKEFLKEVYKEGEKAEDLLKFFYGKNYNGVSLEDCSRLLKLAPQLPLEDMVQRY